jgi:hypothetical protein
MRIDPALLDYATDEERAELTELLAMLPPWAPDPRNVPQCLAYDSPAFEILYGGAAGGGKSDLLLGLARTRHTRSLLLRRQFPDLERSLISRSFEFFGDKKQYNDNKHIWQIGGLRIEYGHMMHIGTPQIPGDESQYASAPYDLVGFDQLEQFLQYAYEFMFSRARSTNKQQRVQVVSTANPVGEGVGWIMRRWGPWLDKAYSRPAASGELRWFKRDDAGNDVETTKDDPDGLSRTFIAAGLKDNPYLGDEYRVVLNNMPEPLRSALLNGDWTASLTDDAYQVIPRAWVKAAMARWVESTEAPDVIGCDVARGGDDKTVISPRKGDYYFRLQKYPGSRTPDGQSVVALLASNALINIDVIGIGASAFDIGCIRGLRMVPVNFAEGSDATDRSGTLRFVNKRAECWWSMREALDPASGRNLALPPDPELEADLCAPRWVPQSNGLKIEAKEDIKKRIGRSPDCGDAAVLANATTAVPFVM